MTQPKQIEQQISALTELGIQYLDQHQLVLWAFQANKFGHTIVIAEPDVDMEKYFKVALPLLQAVVEPFSADFKYSFECFIADNYQALLIERESTNAELNTDPFGLDFLM